MRSSPPQPLPSEGLGWGRGVGEGSQERANRFVEPQAGLFGRQRVASRQFSQARGQFRQDRDQGRRRRAGLLAQPVGRSRLNVPAERLQEGQIGRHPLGFRGAAPQDGGTGPRRERSHFIQEAGLPDPRLPGDQRHADLSTGSRLKVIPQQRQFALSPDERWSGTDCLVCYHVYTLPSPSGQ